MPKEDKKKDVESISLDPRSLESLAPGTLDRLRNEFGATIELKASKAGMAALLDRLAGPGLAGEALSADYDRGFDRTSPGYDKYYDRDANVLTSTEADLSNPVIDLKKLNDLFRR